MADFPQSISESIKVPTGLRYARTVRSVVTGELIDTVGTMSLPCMAQGYMKRIFTEGYSLDNQGNLIQYANSVVSDPIELHGLSHIVLDYKGASKDSGVLGIGILGMLKLGKQDTVTGCILCFYCDDKVEYYDELKNHTEIEVPRNTNYLRVAFQLSKGDSCAVLSLENDILCFYPDEVTTPNLHRRLDMQYTQPSVEEYKPDTYEIFVSGTHSFRTTTHYMHNDNSTESEVP